MSILSSGVMKGLTPFLGRAAGAVVQHAGYSIIANQLDSIAAAHPEYNAGTRALIGATSTLARYKSFQAPISTMLRGTSALYQANRPPIPYKLSGIGEGIFGDGGLAGKAAHAISPSAIIGFAGGIVGNPIKNLASGTKEYAGLARQLARGGKGWLGAVGSMESPLTPALVGGLTLGAVGEYYNRSSYPNLSGRLSGFGNSYAPVNPQNFGRGIAFGSSALTSSETMDGQSAVTNRMLKRRVA